MPSGSGDRWPDDYERGRPGWPRAAVDVADLSSRATVVDVGAGTGKLTRILVHAFAHVIAVEPADAMRRMLTQICPDAEAHPGDAHAIPVADASVDAVFAAQAFHWFDDRVALAELARVLRSGGALVIMWNVPAGAWEPSTAAAEEVLRPRIPEGPSDYDPLDLGGPQRVGGQWNASFADAGFTDVAHTEIANPQTLDPDGLVAYFASMGWIANLDDDERLPLLGAVRAELDASEYRREWATHVYTTRLAPGS